MKPNGYLAKLDGELSTNNEKRLVRRKCCSQRGITVCDTPLVIKLLDSSSVSLSRKSSGCFSLFLRTVCLKDGFSTLYSKAKSLSIIT